MVDRSIRCALWMKSQGLKPGDVIAICTDNHLDSIIPCLAALYTGIVFNPWWDHGLTKGTNRKRKIKYFEKYKNNNNNNYI